MKGYNDKTNRVMEKHTSHALQNRELLHSFRNMPLHLRDNETEHLKAKKILNLDGTCDVNSPKRKDDIFSVAAATQT